MSVELWDFWAPWCGPCRLMKPKLEEISDNFKVIEINVDEEYELAKKHNISSIPTFLVMQDGQEKERILGITSVQTLKELLKTHD